jgi:hypothetical protein
MEIKNFIPYPHQMWGAEIETGKEIMIHEREMKLPEGEYNIGEHDFPILFVNSETSEISFVYRELGTGKIKVHDVNIIDELEEIKTLELDENF